MGNPMSKVKPEGSINIGNVLARIKNDCHNRTGILRSESEVESCLRFIKAYNNSIVNNKLISNAKYGRPFPNQIMYWTAHRGNLGDKTFYGLQNGHIKIGESVPSQVGKTLFYILTTFPFILCIILIFWVVLVLSGKRRYSVDLPDIQNSHVVKENASDIASNTHVGEEPGEIILHELEERGAGTSQDTPSENDAAMRQEQRDTNPVELPEVVRCYFCRAICGEVMNANIRKDLITQGNQIGESVLQKMAFKEVIKEEAEMQSDILEAEAEHHDVGDDGEKEKICKTEIRRDSWIYWDKIEEEPCVSPV